jgi:tricorn protease
MRRTLILTLAALTLALFVQPALASDPIQLARTPDVSPDGKTIAVSYLGDIYTVETIGGTARAITSHPAHDVGPVFSPDGSKIAFSSNRHGSYDVFVTSVRGGKPTRLTFDSATDMACGWTPDGKHVLFASTRSTSFPQNWELYTVPAEGGKVRRVAAGEAKDGSFSPKGDKLAYVRGPGSWYRKGYRGSSNDDVWVCNADGSNSQRLTTFNGQDHSPMWNADGSAIYYVSEHNGMANVVCLPVTALDKPSDSAKPKQVTSHTEDGVRRARISRNGECIVYECGADLWVVSTKSDGKPRKIAIEVNADEKSNNEKVTTFAQGATEFSVNNADSFIVFAVHGKLFRMPVGTSSKATQLTFGKSNDHGATWSPDSTKILFVSDQKGQDDVYVLEADDPDHPKLTEAHKFKVTQLTDTREGEIGVSFSPDGKKIAFIRGGKLWTMSPDGKDQKEVVKDVQVFDYEWSPDSRWLAFARRDGSFASELYIVPAGGATTNHPVRNVTRYATFNGGVTWSRDGKRLAFLSDRRNAANLHILDLEKEAVASKEDKSSTTSSAGKPPLTIDWEDVHERVKPVVRGFVEEAAISPDGSKIALRDASTRDLWVASASGSSLTRLTTGGASPRQIQWTKKSLFGRSLDVLYFLDGSGKIRLCNAGSSGPGSADSKDGKPNPDRIAELPFKVKMTVKTDELYQEMFEQSWRYLRENFYDEKFHGSNWDEVRKRYQPLVKHVQMKEDLYSLLYLMMGELNASHLGVSGFVGAPEEDTAELGLIWDESYKGKGLKVAELLKRGPADKKGLGLKAGDVILSIDGEELNDNANLSKILNGKVGESVVLKVTDKPDDAKAKVRRIEVTAMGRNRTTHNRTTSITELMYDRWVAKNAAKVSELSDGKLGYIHIPSMDEEGLDRFVRSLYSDNYDKEAIVLDVRFNGGGYTHDQVLNYLGGKEHAIFRNRDGGSGLVLRSSDRKWHKPAVLLINNRSYSDAEIFPNAFRTLELGKLVGEPTGGFVIGTMGVRLIDGSTFRIPRIGVYTTKGVNMEKEGVKPDVLIEPHPDQLAKGIDSQLEKAVEVVKADVIAWKKKREPTVAVKTDKPVEKPTLVTVPKK